MSSYEQVHPDPQHVDTNQALPVVTGREMGMQLNQYTSWQFLGGCPDEYGRPATTTWFAVDPLNAQPLAVAYDHDSDVRQELHAVLHVPGTKEGMRSVYMGILGVDVRGNHGLLMVTLPSKDDPALIVDGYSHLNTEQEARPTRRIGNTVVSYEPSQGIVTVTSYDAKKQSAVATAEHPMPRDTSILGASWTLPPQDLCYFFDPQWPTVQAEQMYSRQQVHDWDAAMRQWQADRTQTQQGQTIEPIIVDPEQPLEHVQRAEAFVVERAVEKKAPAPEQPTLQDVYAAYQQASYPGQQGIYGRDMTAPYGSYGTAQTPDYASAATQTTYPEYQHPYFADEEANYGG